MATRATWLPIGPEDCETDMRAQSGGNVTEHLGSCQRDHRDTVIVVAHEDGFQEVFLGRGCWYAVRMSADMVQKVRYIAAYRTAPVRAITHVAEVERIEPFEARGKYILYFRGVAQPIETISFADAPSGSMRGVRYTSFDRLRRSRTRQELFGLDDEAIALTVSS